ncbi:NAD-dependent epimerase/dehydratase family protein [Micromonospora globispora]|uniref:NAD-dependent epimerase/dehydratase family protein n=1 Tax=Micromonospora globispora TaxID=1450148 RepID=UPI000F5FA0EF|nr:NAD(P)-dependent oxidoreductase [Micromonospora globispora]RQX05358.1 NAD(P)-dependent oxidoreductase [Micromonospora globispora]
MRVLLAGASGAVGTPLTRQLIAAGHQVVGITRSQANAERLRTAGAEAVVADVLDREHLLAAVRDVRADAVMHQLTALGTTKMREAMQGTNALRTTGTAHLLAAARAVGAHRFLTQSIVLGYGYRDHGPHVITEDDPFAEPQPGPLADGVTAIRSTEEQVFSADEMEGIALRYGAFYGQDSFTRMIINLVRKRRLPVPSSGGGFVNFIYLEDAAAATVAALEKGRAGQAYNIVDDEPVRWADYLDALAAELGMRRPWRVPTWMLRAIPYLHAIVTTSMRVSNAKARRELGWAPAVSTYREGIPLVAEASR